MAGYSACPIEPDEKSTPAPAHVRVIAHGCQGGIVVQPFAGRTPSRHRSGTGPRRRGPLPMVAWPIVRFAAPQVHHVIVKRREHLGAEKTEVMPGLMISIRRDRLLPDELRALAQAGDGPGVGGIAVGAEFGDPVDGPAGWET